MSGFMWAVLGCPFVLMAYTVTDYPAAVVVFAGIGVLCALAAAATMCRDLTSLWRTR